MIKCSEKRSEASTSTRKGKADQGTRKPWLPPSTSARVASWPPPDLLLPLASPLPWPLMWLLMRDSDRDAREGP